MLRLLTFSGSRSARGDSVVGPATRNKNWSRAVSTALLVAVGYYVGTLVGLAVTPPGATVSYLWPPNAILFAGLLLLPYRYWWVVLIAVLPVHLFTQLHTGVPLDRSLGWFVSNSAEALVGAYCVRRFAGSKPEFDSVRGMVAFLAFGFLLAPVLTSFLDAAVVVATIPGVSYWTMWTRRLFTNMLSILAIVPPLVIIGRSGIARLRKARKLQYVEFALVTLGVFLITIYVFGEAAQSPKAPALIYAPLPLLLWAAVRIGPGGLSTSLLIVAIISIWETVHVRGPFAGVSTRENVIYLEISYCMVAVPLMLLAAMHSERGATELELRESKAKLIDAQERERRRIASELHDDVGQQLALAQIRLAEIKPALGTISNNSLNQLSEQLSDISDDVREISHGLYPTLLQNLGLSPALKRLCRETCLEKIVDLDLSSVDPKLVPADVSLTLYRVAQEALHNVEKHSHARHVSVALMQVAEGLMLRVKDDGVGFNAEQQATTGIGIDSMRERLRSVGGELQITTAPMRGTEIEAFAPLKPPNIELSETA